MVEMTEVSPMDGNEITSNNNSRIQHFAQIGQNRNPKSKIESTPIIVNLNVEMKPTFNNILYLAWYPDKEDSPLSGQTGFHSSGLCGGRKRKL